MSKSGRKETTYILYGTTFLETYRYISFGFVAKRKLSIFNLQQDLLTKYENDKREVDEITKLAVRKLVKKNDFNLTDYTVKK
jgi:hypothetical protein